MKFLCRLLELFRVICHSFDLFQPAEGKLCKFLNIYAAWEPGSEYDLDTIARKSRNQNHINIFSLNPVKICIILAGVEG